jgi:hypothetical protein
MMIRRLVENRDILMRTLLISGLIIVVVTPIVGFHPVEAGGEKTLGWQQGIEDCKSGKPFDDKQQPNIQWKEGYNEGWEEEGCKIPKSP